MKINYCMLFLICFGLVENLTAMKLRSGSVIIDAAAIAQPVLASVRDGVGRVFPLCRFEKLPGNYCTHDYNLALRIAAWWVQQQCDSVKVLQAAHKKESPYFYSDEQMRLWLSKQRAKALESFKARCDGDIEDEDAIFPYLYKSRFIEIVRRFEDYLADYALSDAAIKNGIVPRAYVEPVLIEAFARAMGYWFGKPHEQVAQDLTGQVYRNETQGYRNEIAAAPSAFCKRLKSIWRFMKCCCSSRR
jgi:hypothetical protein